ncbi:HEAT repeat domain-containing protein [Brasilonema bromeliae]|uniref:Signal transduction protein n=1 Tax=Brasilonema bromeliae SPC951 TaxID=385972 RepID=A0ABX1P1B1_9CYAN|nr:HEAT repeat domain-containing protein [Brasilonema bromeliae]NMG18089.1 signal transduction protein [Brasilonema bromeliae SPC951]
MESVTLTAVVTAIASILSTLPSEAVEKIGENIDDSVWVLRGKLVEKLRQKNKLVSLTGSVEGNEPQQLQQLDYGQGVLELKAAADTDPEIAQVVVEIEAAARTLDFSYPQQVEKFIHKWFAAIPKTGEQLCTALKEPGKERIQDLVKNPLLLTLLCLNWQSGDGKLPDTQAGLYQQLVDNFYKWRRAEFATNDHQRQQLNVKLGELAKAAIDKETIRFRLQQDFVSDFLGDADDENSLLKLALNLGWLNCVGIDTDRKPVYAFFHTSFQEYFAAKAIDDWHFFLNHILYHPSLGTYRIFEPQWKQTILLWLGRPEENLKQQKQQFINALVNFKDGIGKWNKYYDKGFYEYRAYILAAAGIAEFRSYSRADRIVAQIVKWVFGEADLIGEEAKLVLQHTDRTKVIAALVQLLQSNRLNDYTRIQVASSLGKIAPGNENAIAALVQLLPLNSLYTTYARYTEIAKSLGEIGTGNEIAISALVQMLLSTNISDIGDYEACKLAAESLGQIGTGNEIAITALLQLLQSPNLKWYNFTRWQAAESLEKIVTANENVIVALVQLLQSNGVDENTRNWAAKSLGKIGTGNENAIAALVKLLQSTNVADHTRRLAAESLGKIGTGNKVAIAALVQQLQSTDVDDYTCELAASSLGKIDPGNEIAIAALVKLLQSTNVGDHARRLAAESLGEIDPGNEIAIAALVQLLVSNDVKAWTYTEIAESLRKIDPGNENVITALVQLLQSNDLDDFTRRLAAYSLGKIDPGNEIAIAALVQQVQSTDVDDYTCELAAYSLGIIGTGNENAIAALVQLLQSTNLSQDTRGEAAESLKKIGTGNENAIVALVQLLLSTNVDHFARMLAVQSLGKIGTGNVIAITALVQVLLSTQLLLSTNVGEGLLRQAAESLGEIGTGNENAIAALVQLLQSSNTNMDDYNYTRIQVANSLIKILQDNKHRFAVVKTLSGYNCYGVFWECAQNMPYPDFYRAWHHSKFATGVVQGLKEIFFTRII